MSEQHSTRKPDPYFHREHARAAIAAARSGHGPTIEQAIALARIRVRMQAAANRHELGTWRAAEASGDGDEVIACLHCRARGFLSRITGVELVVELLEACK